MKIVKKAGFTMAEIVVVSVILAIGFSSIIMAMNNGLGFVQKTRQKIISINLVREGMEAVYQIRDTNWRRWSGKKDQCWLKKNPLVDENSQGCENDEWLGSGNYILSSSVVADQRYFLLSGDNVPPLDLSDRTLDSTDKLYSLCEVDGQWTSCPGAEPSSNEGVFLRSVEGQGLFFKDIDEMGGRYIDCTRGTDKINQGADIFDCGGDRAKEYRFCSQVAYMGKGIGETTMCGVLTNFIED